MPWSRWARQSKRPLVGPCPGCKLTHAQARPLEGEIPGACLILTFARQVFTGLLQGQAFKTTATERGSTLWSLHPRDTWLELNRNSLKYPLSPDPEEVLPPYRPDRGKGKPFLGKPYPLRCSFQ